MKKKIIIKNKNEILKNEESKYCINVTCVENLCCKCSRFVTTNKGNRNDPDALIHVKPGIYLSTRQTEACWICLCTLVYIAHHTAANSFGWPHSLHILIHWLLVHQSEAQPNMYVCTCHNEKMDQYQSRFIRVECAMQFLAGWDKAWCTEADAAHLGLPRTLMYLQL